MYIVYDTLHMMAKVCVPLFTWINYIYRQKKLEIKFFKSKQRKNTKMDRMSLTDQRDQCKPMTQRVYTYAGNVVVVFTKVVVRVGWSNTETQNFSKKCIRWVSQSQTVHRRVN